MSSYNPDMVSVLDNNQGFPRLRVDDTNIQELLKEVIIQLKIVSLKLDCLQPNEEEIDRHELDSLEE